jgi:hypothetical protein
MADPSDPFGGPVPTGTSTCAPVAGARLATRLDPRRATLEELAGELAIFSHGCLLTRSGLTCDPAEDYCQQQGNPLCRTYALDFPWPVFEGIARCDEERVWDHRLVFIRRAFWADLLAYMTGVTVLDRQRGRYGKATVQPIPIIDRLAVTRGRWAGDILPVVTVTCFGYDGNEEHARFWPRLDGLHATARVVRRAVDPATVREARALCARDVDPAALLTEDKP